MHSSTNVKLGNARHAISSVNSQRPNFCYSDVTGCHSAASGSRVKRDVVELDAVDVDQCPPGSASDEQTTVQRCHASDITGCDAAPTDAGPIDVAEVYRSAVRHIALQWIC